MSYLILVRHGESEWNLKGVWTGWNESDLTEKGREEAKKAGQQLHDIPLHKAYTSDLKRAQETLEIIKKELGQENLETVIAPEIKERDYGDLAGKNKWEMKEKYGEEQFMKWRRSWDHPIPNGETLKKVYERVAPYYDKEILPELKRGKNIIVSAHGNSLRALVKHLENVDENFIPSLEIGTGEVYVYEINTDGSVINKEIKVTNPKTGKV